MPRPVGPPGRDGQPRGVRVQPDARQPPAGGQGDEPVRALVGDGHRVPGRPPQGGERTSSAATAAVPSSTSGGRSGRWRSPGPRTGRASSTQNSPVTMASRPASARMRATDPPAATTTRSCPPAARARSRPPRAARRRRWPGSRVRADRGGPATAGGVHLGQQAAHVAGRDEVQLAGQPQRAVRTDELGAAVGTRHGRAPDGQSGPCGRPAGPGCGSAPRCPVRGRLHAGVLRQLPDQPEATPAEAGVGRHGAPGAEVLDPDVDAAVGPSSSGRRCSRRVAGRGRRARWRWPAPRPVPAAGPRRCPRAARRRRPAHDGAADRRPAGPGRPAAGPPAVRGISRAAMSATSSGWSVSARISAEQPGREGLGGSSPCRGTASASRSRPTSMGASGAPPARRCRAAAPRRADRRRALGERPAAGHAEDGARAGAVEVLGAARGSAAAAADARRGPSGSCRAPSRGPGRPRWRRSPRAAGAANRSSSSSASAGLLPASRPWTARCAAGP